VPAPNRHFLADALDAPERWGLRIERTGGWLVRTLELAADSETRRKGLLGRYALAPETGFVIAPSQGVHTFGMRFPIDIVFLDRELEVRKVVPELGPWRAAFARGARSALELPPGEAGRRGIAVGERLESTSET
jgi:uncharacterized protein